MNRYFPIIIWSMLLIIAILSVTVAYKIQDRLVSIEENLDKIDSMLQDMPKKERD